MRKNEEKKSEKYEEVKKEDGKDRVR